MLDFVPETSTTTTKDSLTNLLCVPYKTLSETLKNSAFAIQQTVVNETWELSGNRVQDYSLYTGALGTAYLVFKAYQFTQNENHLKLHVTFICGRAGVCALGAVLAKHAGDERLLNHYLTQFKEIKLASDLPNELYGRVGFLWACAFLNKHIGKDTISTTRMRAVVDEIIKAGRRLANKGRCPLMYEWHGKKYWGAAHGLAGIMHVLMDMELKLDEVEDVKGTLRDMIKNRFTLVKAAQVFGDEEFLQAAVDAGELVWKRGLLKRVRICHGISGNTYVFLALYRLTGKAEYFYRAKAFACFLLDRAQKLILEGKMHGGDRPYSLFEGIGGMTSLFLDMIEPSEAKFLAYEL
ncbi:hypothetical protein LWI29_036940 [Acer saccharum]|uniref:Uncharacterized protein n=1 Tax=Acer saccharum TaxID=4024 RepID=A0AA39W578_ACESA|nr:hypothetical protein LWI29_036940 [Acer saccharum]